MKRLGIDTNSFCPDSRDFTVSGNTFSDKYESFQLSFEKCTGGGWASDPDITSNVSSFRIDVQIVNTYFDFEDYDKPVKTYIDDRFLFDLVPTLSFSLNTFIQ